MLQTNESWELQLRGQILGTFFCQPGLRHYPCIEIPLNRNLFHIDVVLGGKHQDDRPWSRFIFDEIADVLKFIARDDIAEVRLSLQTKRCANEEYTISSIDEIVMGMDREGHETYLFRTSNGITYLDSFIAHEESDLSERRSLWTRPVRR